MRELKKLESKLIELQGQQISMLHKNVLVSDAKALEKEVLEIRSQILNITLAHKIQNANDARKYMLIAHGFAWVALVLAIIVVFIVIWHNG